MELTGIAAAPGIAVGPTWRHVEAAGAADPILDARLAADRASAELLALAGRARAAGRGEHGGILEAQAMMALDPMLLERAEARFAQLAPDPEARAAAVEAAAEEMAATIAALPDPILSARAVDVRDVGARIARIVAGRAVELPTRPAIAIADDLPPSIAAEIDEGLLRGIALERGSTTSHAAILARGLGIPAVVGVRGLLAATAPAPDRELTIAIDGSTGRVILDPTDVDRRELEAVAADREREGAAARALRGRPGRTADGTPVALLANIGRPEEATRAIENGAEGVGLFRTEFLFVGRLAAPSEDQQAAAYAEALRAFPGREVVIRLIDVGGDKPLPYLRLAPEANPFLGIRGIRLATGHRELLLAQIRAVARAGAAAGSTPSVMAPMVSTLEDVRLVQELVAEALADLDRAGQARCAALRVGIMIEVPSAALLAAELARHVDFFSIGSNDLTQYVLAMDRTHPDLAGIADALHPAVLRAIRATVEGARDARIPVAVCGELAGEPIGALILAGIGASELSMDAGRLDAVRLALAGVTSEELRALADEALAVGTAAEVRAIARRRLPAAAVA